MDINFYRLMDFAPEPVPSKNILPEWYQQQPGYHGDFNEGTIKRCMPIFDNIVMGYLILSPCDISVDSHNDKLVIDAKENVLSTHNFGQYSEYPIADDLHSEMLRIHPGWAIKTSPGVSTLFLQPMHRESSIVSFSAVVDTDKFFSDGHLSFFVKKNSKFVIKKGTPIAQVLPFARIDCKMNIFSLEDGIKERTELDKVLMPNNVHLDGGYKKLFRVPKNFK